MNKYSQLLKKLGLSAAALALSAALAVDSAAAAEADVNAEEGEEVVEDFDVDGFLEGIESEEAETAPEEESVTEATEEVSTRAAEEVAEVEQDNTIAQPEEVLSLKLESRTSRISSSQLRVYLNLDWRVNKLSGSYQITNSDGKFMDGDNFTTKNRLHDQINLFYTFVGKYPDGVYTFSAEAEADEQDNNQKFADSFKFTVKDGAVVEDEQEASEEPEVEAPTPEEPQEPEVTPEPAPEEKESEKTPEPEQPTDNVDEEKPAADKQAEQKPAAPAKEEQKPEAKPEEQKPAADKKEESFDDLRPLEELPLGGHASSFDKNGFPINWSEAKKQAYIEKFGLPKGAKEAGKKDSASKAKANQHDSKWGAFGTEENATRYAVGEFYGNGFKELTNLTQAQRSEIEERLGAAKTMAEFEAIVADAKRMNSGQPQSNQAQSGQAQQQKDGQKQEARGERLPDTATGAWALGAVGLSTILAGLGVKKFKKD